MVYFGKSVHLSRDLMDLRDEVKVFQQHCGGENLCVYKGRLKEGESFQFVSRRHRGFPFSLMFYLNGLQVERLSSCCEFKHRKSSRSRGCHAHFGFSGVEGAAPCYRCIIAMGLDKKPTPPKRSINDPLVSKSWEIEKEQENCSPAESSQSHNTETKRNTDQVHQHKEGYEEDFEADDEGPMNDGVEEANVTSPSREQDETITDEHGNEDMSRESEEMRGTSSVSTGLSRNTFSSEEDEEECYEEQKEEAIKSKIQTDTETSERDAEEMEVLQTNSIYLFPEDNPPNQRMEHTEKEETKEEHSEGVEHADDTRKAKETKEETGEAQNARKDLREETAGDVYEEEGQVKSVQEKFAKAVLIMSECVSEPELSDSTTEEDEMVTVEIQQLTPGSDAGSHMDQNGAEPLQEAEREAANSEEPKEELKKETPEPETELEREEKDGGDKQNNKDEAHKDQKPELKQDTSDGKEGENQDGHLNKEENQLNNKPEMMEKPEYLPEEVFTLEEETTNQNSATRAPLLQEEDGMMEITELQPENPRETSEIMDQNIELQQKLSALGEGSAGDQVTKEVRTNEEESCDEESRNERKTVKETENDITVCAEEANMEDGELESKFFSVKEVKDGAEKSKERVEEPETKGGNELREDRDGVETDVRDELEEAKDQLCQSKNDEITEEELIQDLTEEKDAELKNEGKDTEQQRLSEDEEERTEDGEADAVMQKIALEQNTDNRYSTEHEALHDTPDGPEETSGKIKFQEDIMTVDQEEVHKKKAAGAGEAIGLSSDMIKGEGVKNEQMDDEKKETDQSEIRQETRNEDDEVQEVGEFKQKFIVQQETTNEEEAEQRDEEEILGNSNKANIQNDATSDNETAAEDPSGAESEPRVPNVQQDSQGEEESRGADGNHLQTSLATTKQISVDAAKESRSEEEGSSLQSEESQPLEKVLLVKTEEREAKLILAPETDNREMVSNWVNLHQASNYFETFVEPLYDRKVYDREKSMNAEALDKN